MVGDQTINNNGPRTTRRIVWRMKRFRRNLDRNQDARKRQSAIWVFTARPEFIRTHGKWMAR